MPFSQLKFRVHAIRRMFERNISREDVQSVIKMGKCLKSYPNDTPYPSYLILGWLEQRPIHVVAADNMDQKETIIITAYEPELDLWEPGFERKKQA